MNIETWPLDKITPYPQNARRIPQSAIDVVAKSIAEFGWQQPIVVDEAGVIVIGHVRRLAALKLGYTEVPVHVARGLSPEKIRALRLMDNRSHDEAQWDPEVLTAEMLELRGLDLDLSLTGFDDWKPKEPLNGTAKIAGLEYRIVLVCDSESHQTDLLERFAAEGLTCQALIS